MNCQWSEVDAVNPWCFSQALHKRFTCLNGCAVLGSTGCSTQLLLTAPYGGGIALEMAGACCSDASPGDAESKSKVGCAGESVAESLCGGVCRRCCGYPCYVGQGAGWIMPRYPLYHPYGHEF